jgi:acyl carrier protein
MRPAWRFRMKEKITEFIQEINEYEDFEDDTDLFENGILDSLSLVLLINNIEERLGVFIPEEVVTLENFATVNKIAGMVDSLKG